MSADQGVIADTVQRPRYGALARQERPEQRQPVASLGAAQTGAMPNTVPGFDRLTVEPGKLGGQPCIRGCRFTAQQLLEFLAAGNTFDEVHKHFDFLEVEDVRQALGYAAALADRDFYLPTSQPA